MNWNRLGFGRSWRRPRQRLGCQDAHAPTRSWAGSERAGGYHPNTDELSSRRCFFTSETVNLTQESARKLILSPLNEVRRGKPAARGGLRGSFHPNVEMMRSFGASGRFVRRRARRLEKEICRKTQRKKKKNGKSRK